MTFRDELVELLADNEHATWASWMEWVFDEFECGKLNEDGSFTIRADRVKRWKRQIETKYTDLTEEEKESDHMQVYDTVTSIINLVDKELPVYDTKLSRQYFQPNSNPNIAHKNGYRLAVRDMRNKLKEK